MKLELCNFSGYKIYSGHGKQMVRLDGKLYHFLSKKAQRSFLMKRNPRKISWTVLYRKKHKKGSQEEVGVKEVIFLIIAIKARGGVNPFFGVKNKVEPI